MYLKVVGRLYNCGTIINRDINATKNMTEELKSFPVRPVAFKPIEIEVQRIENARDMKTKCKL